jgi:hypothetical protein
MRPRTYTVLAIARRHAALFAKLLAARSQARPA